MTVVSTILHALRVTAVWLLIVFVFCGPAGLGASSAFAAAARDCGPSCPCDEAGHDDHADGHAEHADGDRSTDQPAAEGREGGAPVDQCPDDCPNCCCSPVVALAVIPLSLPRASIPSASTPLLAPVDAPARGIRASVFRPPRSLS